MVGQAAERLSTDNIAVAALHQFDHLSGEEPALPHLGTEGDNALGLFHEFTERAGRIEAVGTHGIIHRTADAVQPAQQCVRAARHKVTAAVEFNIERHVGNAVFNKAHQAGQVDLTVLTLQKFLKVIVAERGIFDVNLAHHADLDLGCAGDGE